VSDRLAVGGITFDFGNTLVATTRARLEAVSEATAERLRERSMISDAAAFLAAWATERDRQFRLAVPELREVDLPERAAHVLAQLRGLAPPRDDAEAWDEGGVATRVSPDEATWVVEAYREAFVEQVRPTPDADSTIRAAHERGFRLGILSNWPDAAAIDRYVESRGWPVHPTAIVVSQRVGVIKPHPGIFERAAASLGLEPGRLLHVGDDWVADVVGATRAGWHAAYLRDQQADTPLPTSHRDATAAPDLEIDRLAELLSRVRSPDP
jgi:HAD superfamily hydrolase (TIGR01549 family)